MLPAETIDGRDVDDGGDLTWELGGASASLDFSGHRVAFDGAAGVRSGLTLEDAQRKRV